MKRHIANILLALLPLIALVAAGTAVQRWHRVISPASPPETRRVQSKVTPAEFSAGVPGMVESVAVETGISVDTISRSPSGIDDQIQNIYTVRIPVNASLACYHFLLSRLADAHGGGIMRGMESGGGRLLTLTLGVGEQPTDVIVFRKTDGVRSTIAKMAIIVDDLGIRPLDSAERLCGLEQTVTLSILPFQRHTGDVVDLARDTGTPYMLHMPMEPLSSSANPGKGAISADDADGIIMKKLATAWGDVSGAPGMNNHMGSKATENRRVMNAVMEYLGDRRYYFVDSRTSNATVGFELSRKLGIKGGVMDGYLDVEDDEVLIERRLDELADRARAAGSVIVICHDRPATLAVLERKLPRLADAGITFVSVENIIR